MAVHIRQPNCSDMQVAELRPGQFFGERSLLLGEPRGATVIPSVDSIVVEIENGAMAPLLKARPALMDFLSEVLAERDAANTSLLKEENDKHGTVRASLAAQILKQMRAFFGV